MEDSGRERHHTMEVDALMKGKGKNKGKGKGKEKGKGKSKDKPKEGTFLLQGKRPRPKGLPEILGLAR